MAKSRPEKVQDELAGARAALASEPRLADSLGQISVSLSDGVLTLEGNVPSVAAKKLALTHVAALEAVDGIIDRLHVIPAQIMGDGQIRVLLRDAFLQEPAFSEIRLLEVRGENIETIQDPAVGARGWIEFTVVEGVVTLNGEVPGLGHKRLAGVLAWWVPGSRDVINGLADSPAEADNDDEITDAVRIALEKDPFVNASQIRASTRDSVVTLRGQVPSESEKEMAEADAWYVFGVNGVVDELAVRA